MQTPFAILPSQNSIFPRTRRFAPDPESRQGFNRTSVPWYNPLPTSFGGTP